MSTVGGGVLVWGSGKLGQLGTGVAQSSSAPAAMKLALLTDGERRRARPQSVRTGGLFTTVLTNRGDLFVCGAGKYGRLGTGDERDRPTPVRVEPAKDAKVSAVSAGSWHACAVTYMGRVYSWGYNSKHNVLGRSTGSNRCGMQPGIVASLLPVKITTVSCGHNFTLACSATGQCYSWGCGRYGVLGHGTESCVLEPTQIESLARVIVTKVDAGYAHCAAISEDGRLYTFGKGWEGQLGLGSNVNNRCEPTWLNDNRSSLLSVVFVDVSCSVEEHRGHTLALSADGDVYAFGSNDKGKLGLGDTTDRIVPTRIPRDYFNGERVISISAGGTHSGAVTEGGTVFTWGCGMDGKLGHSEYSNKTKSYYCTKPKKVNLETWDTSGKTRFKSPAPTTIRRC